MNRHFTFYSTFALLFFSMLTDMDPLYAESASAKSPTPERVLHFSEDYSIGEIFIEDESIQYEVEALNLWVNGADWKYLAPARGRVTVPAGHRVKLYLAKTLFDMPERTKDLTRLEPDAIYSLGAAPSKKTLPKDFMSHVASLTGLHELHFLSVRLSGKDLKPLSACKKLEVLSTPQGCTNGTLKAITEIKTLKTLSLTASGLTDKGLVLLKGLPYLEELRISGDKLTGEALVHISQLPNLQRLSLSGPFSNSSMAHLKNCPGLTILQIHIETFNDEGMRHISEIPGLERFGAHWMTGITDKGVRCLKNMPNLKMLDIYHAQLTDASLGVVGQMSSIEYLSLPFRGLTDSGVEKLAGLKNLKGLRIGGSSNSTLSDRSMKAVSQLAQLEVLSIGGKNITNTGIESLTSLNRLRRLFISFGLFTDQSLRSIAELKRLEVLSIHSEGLITTDGLNQLNPLTSLKQFSCRDIQKGTQPLNLSNLKEVDHFFISMKSDFDRQTRQSTYRSLLGDEDIQFLKNLNRIHFLCLSGADISDQGFQIVAERPDLQTLQLFGSTRITNQGLAVFSPNSPILSIRLASGHFTADCLESFVKLERLDTLELTSDIAFDNQCVHAFKQKKKIRKLELKP